MSAAGRGISVFVVLLIVNAAINAQSSMVYSKAFTKKLEHYALEFYQPTERWLSLTNITEDEFMRYDAVFRSGDSFEMRLTFNPVSKVTQTPAHVEASRILTSIATNNSLSSISTNQYTQTYAQERFGADWCVTANFTPKYALTDRFRKGRMISLYKFGRASVTIIVLYNDDLDPYFESPMKFIDIGDESNASRSIR